MVVDSPDTIAEASFSIPAVRAIGRAHSDLSITILAHPEVAPFWRQVSQVQHVIETSNKPSLRSITKQLEQTGTSFQSSLAWEETPAARAFAKVGIKKRFGESEGKLAKYLTDPLQAERKPGPIRHRVEHYLQLARELGADPLQAANFAPPKRPPELDPPCLAIIPGSDYGPAAEWLPERFQELAESLRQETELAILPSPGRPEPAAKLAESLKLPLTELSGDRLLEFLAGCRGLVGNDGSLPHLASFVGTPTVVLFGPNDPEWRRPLGRHHRILHEHVPCSSCLLSKCPLDHRCMTGLEVSRVLRMVRSLLKSS
jgi:heptosyltransferase-2